MSFRIKSFDRNNLPGYGIEIRSPLNNNYPINRTILFYGSPYDGGFYGNINYIKWKYNSITGSAEGLLEITVRPVINSETATSQEYNVSLIKYTGNTSERIGQSCTVTFTKSMDDGGGNAATTKLMNVYLCQNKDEIFHSDISTYNYGISNFMDIAKNIWEKQVGARMNTAAIKLPETLIDNNGNIVLDTNDLPDRAGATFANLTVAEFNNYVMRRFIVRLLNHFNRKYEKFNEAAINSTNEDPFNLDEPASYSALYQNAMALIVTNGFAVKQYTPAALPDLNSTMALNTFLTANGKVLNFQAITFNALTSAFGGSIDAGNNRELIRKYYTPICLISAYMSNQTFPSTTENTNYNGSIIVNTLHEMGHAWYKTEVIDEVKYEQAMGPPYNAALANEAHAAHINGRGNLYCIMRTTSIDNLDFKSFQAAKIRYMYFSDGVFDVLRKVNSVTYIR